MPTTFGLLLSRDAGETFHWVCDRQIGYQEPYIPDYAVAADSTIYATSFDGLRYSSDGCDWILVDGTPGDSLVEDVEIGGDGLIWAATSDGGLEQQNVFASEDGIGFAPRGFPLEEGWFLSLEVSPNDPARVYVTRFVPSVPADDGGLTTPEAFVHRTDDGGDAWMQLPMEGIDLGPRAHLTVVEVLAGDPEVVFLVSRGAAEGGEGDILYRSSDLGQTWEAALTTPHRLRSLVGRSDGSTVMASSVNDCPSDPDMGLIEQVSLVYTSGDRGGSFDVISGQPTMCCLSERGDGELFACGENGEPDFFALGRSANAVEWTEVLRLNQIAGPLDCSGSTSAETQEAYATCLADKWPLLCCDLGVCPEEECSSGGADAGDESESGGSSCSGCSASGAGLGLALLPLLFLLRRRWR